jgi:hypothetical protein
MAKPLPEKLNPAWAAGGLDATQDGKLRQWLLRILGATLR